LELNADWKGALLAARAQRDDLEKLANAERNSTGEYIRPIVLVQAQPRRQIQETLNVDVVKEALTDLGIDADQIAIETGDAREVKQWEEEHKRTLFDDTCPIRYIITVDKLREGWDCPFAYVLCSVREQSGSTPVEQILGRVLRMPKATRKENDALNYAYAFITSTRFQQSAEGLADALVANGFTKFEARAEIETPKLPGFADLPIFAQDPAYRAPAERGEKLEVPQLALLVDDELEPLEPEHFLDAAWDLSKSDATLNEEEFPTEAKKPEDVELDITEQGRIKLSQVERRFVADLQTQLAMLATIDATTPAELVAWLDRHIPHPDITQDQMQNFLIKLVGHLTSKRGMTLEKLSRERLRLRAAAKQKIDAHRANVMQIGFKQMLFDAPLKELRVSPDRIFSFQSNQYPANNLYGGIYLDSLKKHFYRAIGAMNDEEARCANALNNMPKVKYWVRNIERYPEFSFWLPTPTDKFYPDFVAQLENGKVLVVEYKGGHLIDTADTAQKQAIGELWAKRSNKHCMFLLVSDNDYEARLQTAIVPYQ
jgi:type III restriction enzyme